MGAITVLDGGYREVGGELEWSGLGHLQTRAVGDVLERAMVRMAKCLRRRGLLDGYET